MSPPQQDVLKMQTCVLKAYIHCQGCKRKVKKILSKVEGVTGVEVDAEQGRVMVTGMADPQTLINKLAKSNKHAELLEAGKGQQKGILLASSDNGKTVKSKIIQPSEDINKVPIPKGIKVVKEVKVLADDQDDELNVGDGLASHGTKDEGVSDGDADGGSKSKTNKGGIGIGNSGKKGTQQDGKKVDQIVESAKRSSQLEGVLKNRFGQVKAESNISGDGGAFSNDQGAGSVKIVDTDQIPQVRPTQVPISNGGYYQANLPYEHHQQQHHMAAVMTNQPQRPMANNDMYSHPMGYSRQHSHGRVPLPPPPASDPLAHMFNDENANGCSIM